MARSHARWLGELARKRDEDGDPKAAKALAGLVERLNPISGEPGEGWLAGNVASQFSRQHAPELHEAVAVCFNAYQQLLEGKATLGELHTALSDLKSAVDSHAPPEADAVLHAGQELQRLTHKLRDRWPRLAQSDEKCTDAKSYEVRNARVLLLRRSYTRAGEQLWRVLEAGGFFDDAQFVGPMTAPLRDPKKADRYFPAYEQITRLWLPVRAPGYGGQGMHYPDDDLDVDLSQYEHQGRRQVLCMEAVTELVIAEAERLGASTGSEKGVEHMENPSPQQSLENLQRFQFLVEAARANREAGRAEPSPMAPEDLEKANVWGADHKRLFEEMRSLARGLADVAEDYDCAVEAETLGAVGRNYWKSLPTNRPQFNMASQVDRAIDTLRRKLRATIRRQKSTDQLEVARIAHGNSPTASTESGQADRKTDSSKKNCEKLPRNDDVIRLAKALRNSTDDRETMKSIALQFTGGLERPANSLLRQLRRPEHRHLLNGTRFNKRTNSG
ncbi:hypothetical protein Mal64_34670 [Pseudobythopirellula maris]|uniref:Uncharacterized protein n=1 Tax=Pseudobythopirellula maris TaxID=2527991 RepID=A0A5C5ZHJ8_9BACT|nr:hypothetical protein [Pseudobythopirellula maris]TWT86638.1 hypothetical protein Mal64_34670 [Pseudobythopirellula maris]